jgi:aldehyde dehydrogenase (NAD+)
VARQIKAGVVWVNGTNMFDAAAGFGGYRESGFGREGGREGMYEYLRSRDVPLERLAESPPERLNQPPLEQPLPERLDEQTASVPALNRTPKLYIGGKQARPDSGYSRIVYGPQGQVLGEVGDGSRKDIRNAVEAARAAQSAWGNQTAHGRAQVVYYIAENLSGRAAEFAARLRAMTGCGQNEALAEVESSIERLFRFAAWADKYDGAVHHTPFRGVTMAIPEPIGVVGLICPNETPLLGVIGLLAPLIAMGNTVVLVPSETHPLAATDLYQVLDTSDVPGGVINIVTGGRDSLAKTLAEHLDVDGIWFVGEQAGRTLIEKASAGNLKRTWALQQWLGVPDDQFLRQATQIKNIWVPYGA